MKNSLVKYLIISLICLPVFFINIKSSHDWGDDFAQYIHQAKNITAGISQSQTGYIYNPQFPLLGPPSYPVGFPLLLSPVYAVYGNSILHFNLYISLFLFVLALLTFHFLHKHYSALVSMLLVTVFIYNPWIFQFKMEIMSDIPFTLLLLLCVHIYLSSRPLTLAKSILLTLLIGLLISIRYIGLVFVFAVAFDCLRELYHNRNAIAMKHYKYNNVIQLILISIAGYLIYLLLNKIIFVTSGDRMLSIDYILNADKLQYFSKINLRYYMEVMRSYLEPPNNEWQFISILNGTMIFAFIVIGMIKKISEQFDFLDGLVLIYLATIIIYPYSNAGFRFLLPLTPYLIYYVVQGFRSINIKLNIMPVILAILMAVFVLFSYQKSWTQIIDSQNVILQGPQEPESIEAFNYIIKNTSPDSRFNFIKPRALALYTGRSAMSHNPKQSIAEIHQGLANNNIQFILLNNDLSDDMMKAYISFRGSGLVQVWSNSKYFLYKLNREDD